LHEIDLETERKIPNYSISIITKGILGLRVQSSLDSWANLSFLGNRVSIHEVRSSLNREEQINDTLMY
jgi:hypothetical protein